MYEDNAYKLIVAVNRRLDIGPAMNAMAHALAGLVACHAGIEFLDYPAQAGWKGLISKPPIIVLRSDNSAHLERLHQEALPLGLAVNPFVHTMLGSSAAEQQAATLHAEAGSLDYWAVAVFGQADVLKPLTKRFSIYK